MIIVGTTVTTGAAEQTGVTLTAGLLTVVAAT
jgi:hypothetical protein